MTMENVMRDPPTTTATGDHSERAAITPVGSYYEQAARDAYSPQTNKSQPMEAPTAAGLPSATVNPNSITFAANAHRQDTLRGAPTIKPITPAELRKLDKEAKPFIKATDPCPDCKWDNPPYVNPNGSQISVH